MARKLYTFNWWIHPLKTQDWYDGEKARLAPDAFAREIEISYSFSKSGIVFNEFTEHHIQEGDYNFNPDLPLFRAADFGRTCFALFAQRDSYGRWYFFKEVLLEASSTTKLGQAIKSLSFEFTSHYGKPFDTCDPAGGTESYTASGRNGGDVVTDVSIIKDFGMNPIYDRIQAVRDRVVVGNTLIKSKLIERGSSNMPTIIINRKGCPILVTAFQSGYAYKVNKSTQEVLDVVDEVHPYEDAMDCLRYIMMQFGGANLNKKPASQKLNITKFQPTKR